MEVCRVCLDLQHHGSFDPLDGVLRDMVGLLSPEMNMDISDNPVICKTCSLPLDELFNFKTNFLKNEDQIEGKIDKNKGPLDLRDILKGTETIVNQIKAKEKFCRTCLELIDCDSYTVIDPEQPNIYVNCMLNLCLPEMDIELTKNPIMCESCLEKLQKLHHFKSTCLETEKKLNNHCEIFGTNSSGQINLVNVLDSNLAKKSDVIPEIHNSNFLAVQTGELVVRNGLVITKVEASNGDANNDKIKIEDNSDVNEDTKANIELNTKKHEDNVDIEEIIIKQEIKKEMEIEDEKTYKRKRRIVRRRTYKNVEVDTDEEETLQCKICQKDFASFSNLSRHKAIHQEDALFKCDICPHTFNQKSAFDKHKRTHTGEKPYVCDVCKKAFTGASNLSLHKRVHLEEKPFPCPQCEMRFTQRSNMKKHIATQHIGSKDFPCEICNKMFSTKHGVQSHMEIHMGEKPHRCNLCGEEFRHQNGLRVHRMLHYGKNPLTCDICGRQCLHQSALDNHRKTHLQEKPFECEMCKKRFVKEWILKSHMTLHTGEKNFPCGICGKKYADKSKLNFHLKKRCMKGIEIVPVA